MPSSLDSLNAESALRQLTAELLSGERDRASFRQAVADLAQQRLACATVTLWAIEDLRNLHCVTSSGTDPGLIDTRISFDAVLDLLEEVARHKVFQCSDRDAAPAHSAAAQQALQLTAGPTGAVLVIGATLNGRLIGLICATEHDGQRQWSGAEQATLKRMAVQLAACVSRHQATTHAVHYESL